MSELEGQLFEWAGRNRERLTPTSQNGAPAKWRGKKSLARIATEFAQQFDPKRLREALDMADRDCEANSRPRTLAWYIRQLVIVATDRTVTTGGAYAVPVTARLDAMKTLRALQSYGALSHPPTWEAISVTKAAEPSDAKTQTNFDSRFRKMFQTTKAG
jgi:hypothetical protein